MILVTGAAGFIGSNLCFELLRRGTRFIALDNLGPGSSEVNWHELTKAVHNSRSTSVLIERDLNDSSLYKQILPKYEIDGVVHLAAQSHVDRSLERQDLFWRSQVTCTQKLFDYIAKQETVMKVINQITDEVYGEILEDQPSAVEGDPFKPRPPYACSKAAQYYVGKSYFYSHGLPVVSTFPVNNFGPRQHTEKLLPKFITKMIKGEKVPLMASTHFQRDWLAVPDMVSALLLLLERGQPGEDYNIGADNHFTNEEITKRLIMLIHGVPERSNDAYGPRRLYKTFEDCVEIVPDRRVHDCRYAVNSSKIRELGWQPQTPFDPYLFDTIKWYKERVLIHD